MSLVGFLDNCGASSGGGGTVAELSYINSDNNNNNMSLGVITQSPLVGPTSSFNKSSFFNSPGLSLALQTGMEGKGEVKRMAEVNYEGNNIDNNNNNGSASNNNGGVGMRRKREEEHESKSGSDNLEGASGDDQDVADLHPRKKRYHRHTPQQIQQLETVFKECPHPDEKQRLELSKRLCLEIRQVKFWFQNRRTQMKTQLERHENSILRQENDKLRAENMSMRETMRNPMCINCGGPAIIGDISMEEQHLRIENARLKDELDRVCSLASKFVGRPVSTMSNSMAPPMPSSALELGVGTNGFSPLNNVSLTLPFAADFGSGVSNTVHVLSPTKSTANVTGMERSFERSMFLELALGAMDELVKMAQTDEPVWLRSIDSSGREILNHDEYRRCFNPSIGMKPKGVISEASRETDTVIINSLALVETLMDANRWAEMFSGLVARASTTDVISNGMGGTRNGALLLMQAELQVLSPLVPVRVVNFLRFCKQHADGLWVVVDVSIDGVRENPVSPTYTNCRRLPSGCVVQDMPNGCSKVTWIEHAEYDDSSIHQLFRPLVSAGMGFGAQRWIASLQRQCECLAILMSSTVPSGDHTGIEPLLISSN
ncbi:hypothetical protein KSS87_020218 [Heliosperma pusillum]|nr:hypothetical protein KSS87_020218 [Heliosperma pusillum]